MTMHERFPPDQKADDIWNGSEDDAADIDRLRTRSDVIQERSAELIKESSRLFRKWESKLRG